MIIILLYILCLTVFESILTRVPVLLLNNIKINLLKEILTDTMHQLTEQ